MIFKVTYKMHYFKSRDGKILTYAITDIFGIYFLSSLPESQFFRALCRYFYLNCLRQSTFWIHEWWGSLEISTQVTSSHSYNVIASGFFISPISFLTHLCWPQSKLLLYCFRWFLKGLIIMTSNTCNFRTSI